MNSVLFILYSIRFSVHLHVLHKIKDIKNIQICSYLDTYFISIALLIYIDVMWQTHYLSEFNDSWRLITKQKGKVNDKDILHFCYSPPYHPPSYLYNVGKGHLDHFRWNLILEYIMIASKIANTLNCVSV